METDRIPARFAKYTSASFPKVSFGLVVDLDDLLLLVLSPPSESARL